MRNATKYNRLGQFAKDFESSVNYERLRRERLERTQASMKKHGLVAIVAFTPQNYRYITGIKGHLYADVFARYTIVPVHGKPIHWEKGVDCFCATEQTREWGQEVRVANPLNRSFYSGSEKIKTEFLNTFIDQIKGVLKENDLPKGKIGFDSLCLPIIQALQKADIDFVEATGTMMDARCIKTQDEIQILRQATTICDAAFYTMEHSIRPGIRECEVWGEMAKTAYSLGAESFVGILNSGGRTNPYHRFEGSDKIISPGDVVISDICLTFMGYHTCVVRSFVEGGKPTKEQRALYKECYASLNKAMDACKAGVSTNEVADALPQTSGWEYFSLNVGHGLGLSLHEKPSITSGFKDNPIKLEPNMYIAIETYAGLPFGSRTQGIRLEENILITEDGYDVFSRYPFWDEALRS